MPQINHSIKKCIIEGCGRKFHARGWCQKHYIHWQNFGYPIADILELHNKRHTPEYTSWANMKQRCYNKNLPAYKNYGGRGIKVCDEWLSSFTKFLEDMSERPSLEYSLERVDNNKGYSRDNCRWATPLEQVLNTRRNHYITANAETRTLYEWSKITGINRTTIYSRLKKGKSPEEALNLHIRLRR